MQKEHTEESYEIELKSPMGWIKVKAELRLTSPTEFEGKAKLMGLTVPLTDCRRSGNCYSFHAAPKLPFGVVEVSIFAELHEDGTVTGKAEAARHRPMEIRGRQIAAL